MQNEDSQDKQAKTAEARGVKGYVSVHQSLLRPPQLEEVTQTRQQNQKTHNERLTITKAKKMEGGSRLVCNRLVRNQITDIGGGPNERTCLLDTIMAILPPNKNKELMCLAILSSMPTEGDTSMMNITDALATNGLMLKQVNAKYIRKGGAPFHILQERECRMIISVKLTNLEGMTMSHFVAWDGKVIYDRPFTSNVNNIRDRANPERSNMVFAKLYPKSEFKSWQITTVYQLMTCV